MSKTDIHAALTRLSQFKAQGWDKIHRNFRHNIKFTAGDHWTETEKRSLRAQDRPVNVYDLVQKLCDLYVGANIQAHIRSQVYPVNGGDKQTAERLNKWLYRWYRRSHIRDDNLKLLQDQFIGGVMVDASFVSYEDDPLGEIKSQRSNPCQFMFDLSAMNPDQSDASDMMKVVWASPESVKSIDGVSEEIYQKYKALAETDAEEAASIDVDDDDPMTDNDSAEPDEGDLQEWTDSDMQDGTRKGRVRIIEWWKKELVPVEYLYDTKTGELVVSPDDKEQVEAIKMVILASGGEVKVLKRHRKQFRQILFVGDDNVKDEIEPKFRNFPWNFGFGYNLNGLIFGKTTKLIDPQRDFNKRESQKTHIMGRMAKGVLAMHEGAVTNIAEARKTVNSTGGVLVVNDGYKFPQVMTEGSPPAALFQMNLESKQLIEDISGIPPNLQGYMESSHETGPVIAQRIQQGMVGLQGFVENWHIFLNTRAKKVVSMFQEHEKEHPNRMFEILYDDQEMETVGFNQKDAEGVIANLQTGDYEVEYIDVGVAPSHRENQKAMLLKGVEMGLQIPPDLVVEMMDFSKEYTDRIRAYQQQVAEQAETDRALDVLQGGQRKR